MKMISEWSIVVMASAALLPSFAFAQGFEAGGPPPQGAEDRPVTVADTPLDTLSTVLSLNVTQQSQISAIQLSTREQIRDLMLSRPGRPGDSQESADQGPMGQAPGQGFPGVGPGAPGQGSGINQAEGPGQFPGGGRPGEFAGPMVSRGSRGMEGRPAPLDEAALAKINAVEAAATTQIDGVLTSAQLKSLDSLIGQLKDLQTDGVSPRLYGRLQLTDSELAKIHTIAASSKDSIKTTLQEAIVSDDYSGVEPALGSARQKAREAVLAVLTPSQSEIVSRESGRSAQGPFGFGVPPQGGGQFGGPNGPGGPQGFGGPGGFGNATPVDGAGGPPQSDDLQGNLAGGPPPMTDGNGPSF